MTRDLSDKSCQPFRNLERTDKEVGHGKEARRQSSHSYWRRTGTGRGEALALVSEGVKVVVNGLGGAVDGSWETVRKHLLLPTLKGDKIVKHQQTKSTQN
jgi:hypothetical protein